MAPGGFPFEWALGAVFTSVVHALFHPLFWLVIVLVAFQYRRIAQLRAGFFGARGNSILADTLTATAYGFGGGLIGGYLIFLTGITIHGSGLFYLLPVAILLMLVNPRLLCFAYGGGVLAVSNLLFGFPDISIPTVMALVAILHFVESILILASGHLGAVPAYIRLPGGRIVGGFTLQKFWPIPIVALTIVTGTMAPGMELVAMPEWWPLIKPDLPFGTGTGTVVFAMMTLVAGLGYADIATSRLPADKTRISALYLAGYSVTLFVLAVLALSGGGAAWLAALFAPLGHELIIHISKHMELHSRPLFVPHPAGLMVLDVLPHSPAWRAGIRSGDVIVEINGFRVHTRADMHPALVQPGLKEVGYLRRGTHFRRENVRLSAGELFGVMPVPEGTERVYLELDGTPPVKRWLERWRGV
ncbi:PDZ/DHR/GLGF domain protein [Candidatus Desulforudis audaxviator MP104C]|uniref:PDZ/DHR/GLGF domain protein n=1 Tax=Desulforudis audaxviator (strain MP104C) TaxID=477974 RepID=B1I135_DESAP|nr:PDZ domain-containing protein [Candidatus Desulforudis audaxviator]ACA58849.1 PDZ/DHR/GLGF domain protein [Candidatus Desulforudis audaxviator MP104C]AZK58862.1 Cell division topological determinant MinJ [Candidatus Desulforudis audaxviator]